MERKDELINIFSRSIREILNRVTIDFDEVQEIRLRVGAPLLMVYRNEEYYVTPRGSLNKEGKDAYIVSKNELKETMEYMSNYSLYAFEQGFITIQGGHRIGIAGKTILDESGIKTMKYISFINVRLSHQVRGCASEVLPYLYEEGREIYHTLIISPPRCGKTTLLRDLIRQVSNGSEEHAGLTVGVVDERSEIGACYQGIPQNELGIRTDILDCCPKARGMMMLIRTMSPRVIAVDEIGSREDLEAMTPGEHSSTRRRYIRWEYGGTGRSAWLMDNTWLRIIGALLVIISCSGLGFFMAAQWNEHLRTVEKLRKMIFLLKGEIVYANSPLTEAFERTGRKAGGEIGVLFENVSERLSGQQGETFYTIWQEEIDKLPKEVCLSKEDKQNLKGLGEHLGYLDMDMQERNILLYLEQLDLTIGYLRKHKQEKSRLYTSLGIMGGLFLTIVMY